MGVSIRHARNDANPVAGRDGNGWCDMTDELSRRRIVTCVGTTLAVGIAGCSSDGGETEDGDDETATDDGMGTETTGGQMEPTSTERSATAPAEDTRPLTLELAGNSDYESEVVTVESLTFAAASADDESPTLQVGETVDLSEGESRGGVTVADNLGVPYGTYDSVEMEISPEEVIDATGSSVDVSATTVSQSLTGFDDEPTTVTESQFDASLTLYLSIRDGQYVANGYAAVGF